MDHQGGQGLEDLQMGTPSGHCRCRLPLEVRRTGPFAEGRLMISIVVKFCVRREYSDEWLDRISDFTQATRQVTSIDSMEGKG
jgi:hypothetical protein